MASRADTLKLAQVDLDEAKANLSRADYSLRGSSAAFAGGGTAVYHANQAVQALEKVTRRLKRSFALEEVQVQ